MDCDSTVKAVKVLVEAERVSTEGVKEILILLVQAVKMLKAMRVLVEAMRVFVNAVTVFEKP